MKRRFTILTAALALLTFLAVPMGMWGQTNTASFAPADFNGQGTSGSGSSISATNNGVTFACDKGYGTTQIRCYSGGTITISSSNTITAISFTFSSTYTGGMDTTYTNLSTTSWTKALTSQARITACSVSYTSGDTPQPTTYTVTFDAGEGTFVGNTDFPNASNTVVAGTYSLPSATPATGYTFDGWAMGETTYQAGASYTVSGDADFVASYTQNGGSTTTEHQYNFAGANNFYTDVNLTTHPGSGNGNNVGTIYYGDGGVFVASGTNRYFSSANSGYFMLGKTNAEISLPTFEGYKITQVKVHTSSGVSTNVQVSIVSGDNTASAAQQWTQNSDFTYDIAEDYQTSTLSLKVTNNYNSQFTSITLVCEQDIPSSDPSISAENVNIAYDAEEGTINYTINNPVEGGSLEASCDAEWIEVDDTPQTDAEGSIDFLCAPNSNFYAHSATVTLTYTYGDSKATVTKEVLVTQALDPNANGSTSEYPITVSEAIEAIDEVGTVSNIYVGGTVSNIVEEYSSQYHNITFDMIDEEGNEYFLRAYRCGGDDAANVMVGDEVVVYGNLCLYNNSIYEFSSGCQLVSLIHPAVPTIAVSPESVELDAEEGEGAMDITYENLTITAASNFDIQYYNEQGLEISEPDWILAGVNEKVLSKDDATYEVTYTIEANNGPARTAYFKVYAMDDETNLVYSNLVTISQAAAPQQYTLTVEPFENLELITFVNDEMVMEGDGEIQVTEGNQIMLSIVALEGYVMETLMVNGVNHVNDIAADYTYSFDMPAENVIISATAVEDVPPTPGDKYVKVTSTADLTSGQYLIVYEEGSVAFDGSLETLDAASNTIEVTINNSEIGIDNITIASEFTIDVTTGTIMSASGYYIGQTSNANGMQTSLETAYTNTISFDESGNANIVSSGGAYLRYNNASNQDRFRYYKSSTYTGQKAIQLYKKVGEPATETYTLEIAGYGDSDGGYYLIASPAAIKPATVEDPETHENMILTGDDAVNYDLYAFDESEDDEWRNYKTQAFNLQPGKGYLYAHKRGGNFAIVGVPYSGDGKVTLHKTEGTYWEGWNLIGNPWGTDATIETEEGQQEVSFYVMGEDGMSFIPGDNYVDPMQGIFVIAASDEQEVTFVPVENPVPGEGKLIVNLTASRSSVIDRAIVRFGQGTELPKFMFNPNSTKIYIPQSGEDYAVVRSAGEAEMPVNFKAAQNGTYTLSINPANVEMEYLHLVDNMTGTDIDLLETPSYTFEASTTDAANRFSLMYGVETGVNEDKAANFAYFNGSQWVVNNSGDATLQVVDALGRVVSTKTINGNAEVSIDQTAGVYMIRLINGNNVKTQKVVVK